MVQQIGSSTPGNSTAISTPASSQILDHSENMNSKSSAVYRRYTPEKMLNILKAQDKDSLKKRILDKISPGLAIVFHSKL